MAAERIYSKRLYIVAHPEGISGFHRGYCPAIVTGLVLRTRRYHEWAGPLPSPVSAAHFVLRNRNPFGPELTITEASAALATDPYAVAVMTCVPSEPFCGGES